MTILEIYVQRPVSLDAPIKTFSPEEYNKIVEYTKTLMSDTSAITVEYTFHDGTKMLIDKKDE